MFKVYMDSSLFLVSIYIKVFPWKPPNTHIHGIDCGEGTRKLWGKIGMICAESVSIFNEGGCSPATCHPQPLQWNAMNTPTMGIIGKKESMETNLTALKIFSY